MLAYWRREENIKVDSVEDTAIDGRAGRDASTTWPLLGGASPEWVKTYYAATIVGGRLYEFGYWTGLDAHGYGRDEFIDFLTLVDLEG